MNATITGCGVAIPEGRLTNADLEARLETDDAWIVERTGIRERRIAGPGESTASLAITAGQAAIADAGLTADDIGLVIVATATPEQPIPATSAFVQDGLGVRGGAFDVGAACAGFVYALVVAASLVESGVEHAVVVGSETLSRVVDPDDRATAVLFGDGAAAAVVSRAPAGRGLLAWDVGCDGSLASLVEVPAGGSRLPTSAATVADGRHWLRMEGPELFRQAVRAVVDTASAVLARAEAGAADVDLFVPHQANARIIAAAASRLGIPPERTMLNVDRFGNTSAASIPLALAEAAGDGRLSDGDLVLLAGFGAGMTWASALLRWGA